MSADRPFPLPLALTKSAYTYTYPCMVHMIASNAESHSYTYIMYFLYGSKEDVGWNIYGEAKLSRILFHTILVCLTKPMMGENVALNYQVNCWCAQSSKGTILYYQLSMSNNFHSSSYNCICSYIDLCHFLSMFCGIRKSLKLQIFCFVGILLCLYNC